MRLLSYCYTGNVLRCPSAHCSEFSESITKYCFVGAFYKANSLFSCFAYPDLMKFVQYLITASVNIFSDLQVKFVTDSVHIIVVKLYKFHIHVEQIALIPQCNGTCNSNLTLKLLLYCYWFKRHKLFFCCTLFYL